jgi:hypothetical protein
MSSNIQTYAELQRMIRKALREQNPEWIDANGTCSRCDSYEARFAKLLGRFAQHAPGAKVARAEALNASRREFHIV